MPDVFTQTKRSAVVSQIRSTGTAATELRLMEMMCESLITGWRRQVVVARIQKALAVPACKGSDS